MADDPKRLKEPPYPPPSFMMTSLALTTGSVVLMGCGIISLLLWLLADCLNEMNLLLGLVQLLVGLAILIWFLSWWLPTCRRGLREYEEYVVYQRDELAQQVAEAKQPH